MKPRFNIIANKFLKNKERGTNQRGAISLSVCVMGCVCVNACSLFLSLSPTTLFSLTLSLSLYIYIYIYIYTSISYHAIRTEIDLLYTAKSEIIPKNMNNNTTIPRNRGGELPYRDGNVETYGKIKSI